MGAGESKSTMNEQDDVVEDRLPSTPIQSSQFRRIEIDPRSPSCEIARTPIEVLKTPVVRSAANSADTSLNVTDDLEDHISTILDPRSPTTEFHRTPIITEAVLKLNPKLLHNKNLDKVRMPEYTVTPAKLKKIPASVSRKIYDSPEAVSPKLLESSIIVKPAENKRNSIVGLLETNIDFVETDLDEVIRKKTLENSTDGETIETLPEFAEETGSDTASIETLSEAAEVDTGSIETLSEVAEEVKEFDFETEVANMSLDAEIEKKSEPVADSKVDNLEMPKVEVPEIPATTVMLSVDELNKKLTNLIYEDKASTVSPKVTKLITNNRTPLGDRDSNTQQRIPQRKSIPVLKVSDKPTKPVSRIPVFKEKRVKGKMNIQCENTPPRMTSKRSQWSNEDSLLI